MRAEPPSETSLLQPIRRQRKTIATCLRETRPDFLKDITDLFLVKVPALDSHNQDMEAIANAEIKLLWRIPMAYGMSLSVTKLSKDSSIMAHGTYENECARVAFLHPCRRRSPSRRIFSFGDFESDSPLGLDFVVSGYQLFFFKPEKGV